MGALKFDGTSRCGVGLDGGIWGDWRKGPVGLEERFGEPFGGTGWRAVCRPTGFWSGLEDRFWGPILGTGFLEQFSAASKVNGATSLAAPKFDRTDRCGTELDGAVWGIGERDRSGVGGTVRRAVWRDRLEGRLPTYRFLERFGGTGFEGRFWGPVLERFGGTGFEDRFWGPVLERF